VGAGNYDESLQGGGAKLGDIHKVLENAHAGISASSDRELSGYSDTIENPVFDDARSPTNTRNKTRFLTSDRRLRVLMPHVRFLGERIDVPSAALIGDLGLVVQANLDAIVLPLKALVQSTSGDVVLPKIALGRKD
jgi:hypothetical protein